MTRKSMVERVVSRLNTTRSIPVLMISMATARREPPFELMYFGEQCELPNLVKLLERTVAELRVTIANAN